MQLCQYVKKIYELGVGRTDYYRKDMEESTNGKDRSSDDNQYVHGISW